MNEGVNEMTKNEIRKMYEEALKNYKGGIIRCKPSNINPRTFYMKSGYRGTKSKTLTNMGIACKTARS
jgi:hypothetical protein